MSQSERFDYVRTVRLPRSPFLSRWLWLVLLSFVVLLPVAPWFNAPLLLMALSGLWLMALKRKWLSTLTTLGFFTQLFLCIWVPMVLSLFDAVNFAESLRKVMSFLGFYPAGVLVIACASRDGTAALSLGLLRYWQSGCWMASCNSRPGPDCSGFLMRRAD